MGRSILGMALVAMSLVATGCQAPAADTTTEEVEPASIELVPGQEELHRITLTERAAERLGIRTVEVARAAGPLDRSQIPYSSIIYDAQGDAWAYVADGAPLVFVRQAITVDDIVADPAGDYAILSEGPEPGTPVVTVGVAELFGAEFEVGH